MSIIFTLRNSDKIIDRIEKIIYEKRRQDLIVKSIVTDAYGCSIIYDVQPIVNIILKNMKDPVAQKIPN